MSTRIERTLAQEIAGLLLAIENCRTSGNADWLEKHSDRLATLCDNFLPSGSGIDNGTTLDLDASTAEKLVFHTSFHHMDEYGSYYDWTDHTVTVRPSIFFGLDLKISGRNRGEVKEHLHTIFYYTLTTVAATVEVDLA